MYTHPGPVRFLFTGDYDVVKVEIVLEAVKCLF